MQCTLLEWLNSEWLAEDVTPLPWNLSVDYMPIPVVRAKIEFMEQMFGCVVEQTDVQVGAIQTPGKDADVAFWATVKFSLYHSEFPNGVKHICGTASIYAGQYSGTWALAQVCESLATTRAFAKHWKQFGKGLNDKDDPMKDMKAPAKKTNDKISQTLKNIS